MTLEGNCAVQPLGAGSQDDDDAAFYQDVELAQHTGEHVDVMASLLPSGTRFGDHQDPAGPAIGTGADAAEFNQQGPGQNIARPPPGALAQFAADLRTSSMVEAPASFPTRPSDTAGHLAGNPIDDIPNGRSTSSRGHQGRRVLQNVAVNATPATTGTWAHLPTQGSAGHAPY